MSHFKLDIDWLECKDVCLPGSAQLEFQLPRREGMLESRKQWLDIIQQAERTFPTDRATFRGSARVRRDHIQLLISKGSGEIFELLDVDFFPLDEFYYDLNSPVVHQVKRDEVVIKIPLSRTRQEDPLRLRGVIVRTFNTPEGKTTIKEKINKPIDS